MTEPRGMPPREPSELEPLAPELDVLVRRMRADVPSERQLAGLDAAVLAALAAGAPPPAPTSAEPPITQPAITQSTATTTTTAATTSSTGALVLVGGTLAILAGGLGLWQLASSGGAPREHDAPSAVVAIQDAGMPSPDARTYEAPPLDVTQEHVLLERARRLMSSDPAGALVLVEEHARLAPEGMLAPEREVVAIEALRALGRHEEANERLAAFEVRWPGSPYRERLGTRRP